MGTTLGIAVAACSPPGADSVPHDPVYQSIAQELGWTPGQIALRRHLQRGGIASPKTTSPHRIHQDAAVFDFMLGPRQVARIDHLDRGAGRTGPHPEHL
ncbi:hypothetical protein [Streptomyces sp. NPDC015242]|uniref:hypothetical protein n=1 Tax=Streptomyces sp. NPDC015242 TaxID=3364951 RepID=UPI0036FAA046